MKNSTTPELVSKFKINILKMEPRIKDREADRSRSKAEKDADDSLVRLHESDTDLQINLNQ